MKYLIKIAYDGTNYFGWQRQNNFISVQQRVEEALSRLLKKNIEIRGASRTDTGVHAKGQRAVFEADMTIPVQNLPYAINSFLPDDIRVTAAETVGEDFHPQYSVEKKTYEYLILNDEFPEPKLRNYTGYVRKRLDIEKMREAGEKFIGTYDFKAFCAAGCTAKTTVRTIYDLTIDKNDNIISIRVTGNGFLYNMVRIIVGTLTAVGEGKMTADDVYAAILSGDRTRAGKTAPPNGLTLIEIYY